jgi:hypothetical protein
VGGVAFFGFDFGIECLHVENAFDRAAQDALQLRRRDGFRLENIIARYQIDAALERMAKTSSNPATSCGVE